MPRVLNTQKKKMRMFIMMLNIRDIRQMIENRNEVVPGAGVEPARYCYRGILSPLRLPIPPPGQLRRQMIPIDFAFVKHFPIYFSPNFCH